MSAPDVLHVRCPACDRPPLTRCVTLTRRQPTAPHSARYVLYAETIGRARAAHPSRHRHLTLIHGGKA